MSSHHFLRAFAKRSRRRLESWGLVQASRKTDKPKKKKRETNTNKNSVKEPKPLQLKDVWSIKEFSELEYRRVSTRSERYTVNGPKSLSIFLRTQLRRPRLLVRAIRSILDQDLRQNQISMNIILLFSDEVNIDALRTYLCGQMLSSSKNDVTITLAPVHTASRGALLNEGLRLADSDYIFCLDDDDYVYPNHVLTLVNALEASDLVAAYTAADVLHVENDTDGAKETAGGVHYSLWWSYAKLCLHNTFPIQAVMFKPPPEAISFDPELHALEDWIFWLQLMKDRSVVGIPKRTSAYRVPSPGSEYEKLRTAEHHIYLDRLKRPSAAAELSGAKMEEWRRMGHGAET